MEYGNEIWDVECRNLYRAGSLVTVSKELYKYKLHLVEVQVRWEGGGTEPAEYTFFYGKRTENHESCTGSFFVHKLIITAVKRVEIISDRMSYIILRGCWCHIIVLNVHAPKEGKADVIDSYYDEVERLFDNFPKSHMKILLGDFNPKVGRKDFLNCQLGIKVHTKLVITMELEK
jgi:hypothetical protein